MGPDADTIAPFIYLGDQYSITNSGTHFLTGNKNRNIIIKKNKDFDKLWAEVDSLNIKGLPKSALEVVESIYIKAKKENNTPQYLKAVIYKSNLVASFAENYMLKVIASFEEELKTAVFPEKEILHSCLAELYFSYYQQINTEYNANIYYSHDALSNNYHTVGVNIDRGLDNDSYLSFLFDIEKQKAYQTINTIGISYGIYFRSDNQYRQDIEQQLQDLEAELFRLDQLIFGEYDQIDEELIELSNSDNGLSIIPRIQAGLFVSSIVFVSENLQDTGQNINLGAGLDINNLLDISLNYDHYTYASEQNIRSKGIEALPVNPALFELSSLPRSSTGFSISFTPFDAFRLFFISTLTLDLLDQKTLSNTIGSQIFINDSWDLLLSLERTGEGSSYTGVSCGYLF